MVPVLAVPAFAQIATGLNPIHHQLCSLTCKIEHEFRRHLETVKRITASVWLLSPLLRAGWSISSHFLPTFELETQ